ncbi:hypothetical protein GCM10010469_11200 [Streptomyces labedae]|uniref:Uncharacterized protein n=2 Tax=Streptomyces TaxID=1883 RepID=A0ABQ2TWB0_9ACTN|nr:hypothetical protein GCM10010265_24230 [Streptomyces griseoincarnatus]GGT41635.1 hypothetical protein GCM10010287_13040 [Streptomyces variabilis]
MPWDPGTHRNPGAGHVPATVSSASTADRAGIVSSTRIDGVVDDRDHTVDPARRPHRRVGLAAPFQPAGEGHHAVLDGHGERPRREPERRPEDVSLRTARSMSPSVRSTARSRSPPVTMPTRTGRTGPTGYPVGYSTSASAVTSAGLHPSTDGRQRRITHPP